MPATMAKGMFKKRVKAGSNSRLPQLGESSQSHHGMAEVARCLDLAEENREWGDDEQGICEERTLPAMEATCLATTYLSCSRRDIMPVGAPEDMVAMARHRSQAAKDLGGMGLLHV